MNRKWRMSIHRELLMWFVLIVAVPTTVLGILIYSQIMSVLGGLNVSAGASEVVSTHLLTWGIAIALTLLLFLFMMTRALRRRVMLPLWHFKSTLEDISEGFIIDEVPEDIFSRSEDLITDSFQKVIQINRMLMRNVDNLERGFEEERLAKLAQAELTHAYERFVPKEFLGYLQKDNITEVQLGDNVKAEMTILFSDIRAFTTLSETITPEETFSFLNSYLVQMEPIVKNNHGFIDKYIGDAIMALFQTGPQHALQAAVQMLYQLRGFNQERTAQGLEPVEIGIGLNTGSMMLGIVGGENRMEGTVISDAVNLASRVEDMNKAYGTQLLISEHTYQALGDAAEHHYIRLIDRVQVKGKTESVWLYEVFDADEEEMREAKWMMHSLFEEAVLQFHQGERTVAEALFRGCLAEYPHDRVAQHYAERCSQNERTGAV